MQSMFLHQILILYIANLFLGNSNFCQKLQLKNVAKKKKTSYIIKLSQ